MISSYEVHHITIVIPNSTLTIPNIINSPISLFFLYLLSSDTGDSKCLLLKRIHFRKLKQRADHFFMNFR
ncbi:hypothetical protein P8452_03075 [Trifolium repens]|nr:hypothetical protein P8452_03075 [Trifolium repens]